MIIRIKLLLLLVMSLCIASASHANNFEHPTKPGDRTLKVNTDYLWAVHHGWDWYTQPDQVATPEKYSFIQVDVHVSVEFACTERTARLYRGNLRLTTSSKMGSKFSEAKYTIPYDAKLRRYDVKQIQWEYGIPTVGLILALKDASDLGLDYWKAFASSVLDELANDWRTGQVGERVVFSAAGIGYGLWDGVKGIVTFISDYPSDEEVSTNVPIALANLDKCAAIIQKSIDDYFASALSHPNEFALNTGKIGGQLDGVVLSIGLTPVVTKAITVKAAVTVARIEEITGPRVWELVARDVADATVQQALRDQVEAAFAGQQGVGRVFQVNSPRTFYIHNGSAEAALNGRWLSPTLYTDAAEAKRILALPAINDASWIIEVEAVPGEYGIYGQVADKSADATGIFPPEATGGGAQVYVSDPNTAYIFKRWVKKNGVLQ